IAIGSRDGVGIYDELLGQLANRWNQVAAAQHASGHRELNAVRNLAVNRPAILGTEVNQEHFSGPLVCYHTSTVYRSVFCWQGCAGKKAATGYARVCVETVRAGRCRRRGCRWIT